MISLVLLPLTKYVKRCKSFKNDIRFSLIELDNGLTFEGFSHSKDPNSYYIMSEAVERILFNIANAEEIKLLDATEKKKKAKSKRTKK